MKRRSRYVEFTFGVNMCAIPSTDPFSIKPLTMKQKSTTYGKSELKYMTCGDREKHSQTRDTFESSLIVPPFPLVHLPGGGDPLDDGEADDDPGHQQRQGHFDIEAAALCDGAGRVQRLPVPEIGGGRALLALRLHDCPPERGNGE